MRNIWIGFACVWGAQVLGAQAFDVASIKPLKSLPPGLRPDQPMQILRRTPTSLIAPFVPLMYCTSWTYDVPMSQIIGVKMSPPLDLFEISAKTSEPRSRDEMKAMMQTLLVERFHLQFHREKKTVSGYALVMSKRKPLEIAEGDAEMSVQMGLLHAEFTSITLRELASVLANPGEPPVVDMTELEGRFNLKVDSKNYLDGPGPKGNGIAGDREAFLRAMQDQLGLKLESRKVEVEMFVVDRVDKLTEN